MKFRITEGVNDYNGERFFRVYEVNDSGDARYCTGTTSLDEARAYVQRRLHPAQEKVLEEHGS